MEMINGVFAAGDSGNVAIEEIPMGIMYTLGKFGKGTIH